MRGGNLCSVRCRILTYTDPPSFLTHRQEHPIAQHHALLLRRNMHCASRIAKRASARDREGWCHLRGWCLTRSLEEGQLRRLLRRHGRGLQECASKVNSHNQRWTGVRCDRRAIRRSGGERVWGGTESERCTAREQCNDVDPPPPLYVTTTTKGANRQPQSLNAFESQRPRTAPDGWSPHQVFPGPYPIASWGNSARQERAMAH
jgi:hypothetical protein